jgi:hypothetical protein
MKRVRYLAGAAGLAPAAFGLAVAPAAHAAGTDAGHVKTVSLHHVLAHSARADAATSSSSSAQNSPGATTGAACNGNTYFRIPQRDDVRGHGWYANDALDVVTCIGTVVDRVYYAKNICKSVSLYVSTSKGGGGFFASTKSACGTAGHWKSVELGVHTKVGHTPGLEGVWVCAGSKYDAGHLTCKEVGS